MSSDPGPRSVRISDDERGGWSSDRPRPGGGPPRPPDVSTRCRVLGPTDRMRYSPGSLLMIVSADAAEGDRFAQRVLEDKSALRSAAQVRALLAGKVGPDELAGKSAEVLAGAAIKRLEAGQTTVVATGSLEASEREPIVRAAARLRRPRHVLLLDNAGEEDRSVLNELRRALDAGELGQEGFQTALRVGGKAISELKRIVFAPPPADD